MSSQNLTIDYFPARLNLAVEKVGGVPKLSKLSGISRPTIGDYLSGKSDPARKRLVKIAEVSGLNVEWLASGGKNHAVEQTDNTAPSKAKVTTIKKTSKFVGNAALCRAYYAYKLELVTSGFDDYCFHPPEEGSVVHYVENDGEVIAFSIFHETNENNIWIQSSWTHPAHRRQGLNAEIFKSIVSYAKKKRIANIKSGTSAKNKAMQAAYEQQGRKPEFIQYNYEVGGGA